MSPCSTYKRRAVHGQQPNISADIGFTRPTWGVFREIAIWSARYSGLRTVAPLPGWLTCRSHETLGSSERLQWGDTFRVLLRLTCWAPFVKMVYLAGATAAAACMYAWTGCSIPGQVETSERCEPSPPPTRVGGPPGEVNSQQPSSESRAHVRPPPDWGVAISVVLGPLGTAEPAFVAAAGVLDSWRS